MSIMLYIIQNYFEQQNRGDNWELPDTIQECTTSEQGVVVIGTHEPLCVQMEIFVEIFVDFDSL